jgi:hypothetical protein
MALMLPVAAGAQDFGVMESAETINQGNFKLTANPMFIFYDSESEIGVGLKFGYGFTPRFDMEAKLALYDGQTFFGGDFEYWVVKDRPWDVSAGAGFHIGRGDAVVDTTGIDLTLLTSRRVGTRLDFFAALDVALESIDTEFELVDDSFTTLHLVPGIEYAVSDDLDFVAEFGISLNDEGSHYASVGLAYYLR